MRLPRLLDDLSKVGMSALMILANVRQEAKGAARTRSDALAHRCGLASREEVEAALELARTARSEQEALARRVAELEQRA